MRHMKILNNIPHNITEKCTDFFCATIAYHVELSAISGGHRHPANVQEIWTHNTDEMPWNQGDPSNDVAIHFLFPVGHNMEYTPFYCKERDLYGYTCFWILKLHHFLYFIT